MLAADIGKPRTDRRSQSSYHMPKEPKKWAREYLPGYTGHVPLRNDLFGKSAGTINREICETGGIEKNMARLALKESMNNTTCLPVSGKMNKDVFGNWSKYSQNWIGGPTDQIRRQHVPGYTGHVRGQVNKDSMPQSYARLTANLFAKKHPIPAETDQRTRFTSTQRTEFRLSNNRRFANDKEMIPRKDYEDYSKYVNESQMNRRRNISENMGIQTERGVKSTMTRRDEGLEIMTTKNSNGFNRTRGLSIGNLHSGASTTVNIKPRIIESKISDSSDFFNLSNGFKRIFADDKKDKKLVIPVVGYGGHRRGDRSQNYFGKSFRDTTIQSKCLERDFRKGSLV